MSFMPTKMPTAVRQTCTNAFAGVACAKASKVFEPNANAKNVIEFTDPDDRSVNDADAGGQYEFETTVQVKEVRAATAAGNITVSIADRDGTHEVPIGIPTTDRIVFPELGLIVQKSQRLIIKTAAAGWVEAYVIKGDWV
jgi:hypothetical protein